MDNVDPANIPAQVDPVGTLYWAKVVSRTRRPQWSGGCSGQVRVESSYILVNNASVSLVSLVVVNANTLELCAGIIIPANGWKGQFTGGEFIELGNSDVAPVITFASGLVLPVYSQVFEELSWY